MAVLSQGFVRQRQENEEFKDSLGYISDILSKTKKKKSSLIFKL